MENKHNERLLPWVDGCGYPIEKLEVGVIYTIKPRGTYQVALKPGEQEECLPVRSGLYQRTQVFK